eukprot:scaffold926_cov166-Ochromonas_danica.AAC.2
MDMSSSIAVQFSKPALASPSFCSFFNTPSASPLKIKTKDLFPCPSRSSLLRMIIVQMVRVWSAETPQNLFYSPVDSIEDVDSLCVTVLTIEEDPDKVPPVTVMWIKGKEGGNYYYAFGGCHRYEAYKKLGKPTIPAILQKSTLEQLKAIMGGSAPKELL